MAEESGLEKLFFELASESRLGILRELQKENLKMQEIAHRLDITPTEAFRQLERLSAAGLVQRQPDGMFALGEFGKLVLQISTSLDFISRYKDYFSMHDLMRLPSQFVNRLGELSGAELGMDTIESLNMGSQAFIEAKQYAWGIGEGTIPGNMTSVMNQHIQEGIQIKMLISQEHLPPRASLPPTPKNVELRGLSKLPAIVVLTEKAAGICFYQTGGRVDYAGFFGTDPAFHNWVKDLFLYYWEKGLRV
ncbi:MAG TPA: winged helix-turn-helix transcriptional regulator [Candidatus Acidoferrum sp.]|nr:winged helix-turn-helix transcriptional regulator [Candidatus Acidoferrum sp.]